MTESDGISLDIGDDGEMNVTQLPEYKKNECFGGVMCTYCEHNKKEITLIGDSQIMELNVMWCNKANRSVVDIFYEFNAVCPLDYWVKAAMPGIIL